MRNIYPCLTTLTKDHWQKQLRGINKYQLKEVAVFLTGADYNLRQRIYQQLKKSSVKQIPHLHIRDDMTDEEIKFFHLFYKTKQFNLHSKYTHYFRHNPLLKRYFLMETSSSFDIKKLKFFSGYCLDIAHVFSKERKLTRLNLQQQVNQLIKNKHFPQGSHISGLADNHFSTHYIKMLKNFDYLKNAPKEYFSKVVCLEVENSITEQLRFIKYLEKIL